MEAELPCRQSGRWAPAELPAATNPPDSVNKASPGTSQAQQQLSGRDTQVCHKPHGKNHKCLELKTLLWFSCQRWNLWDFSWNPSPFESHNYVSIFSLQFMKRKVKSEYLARKKSASDFLKRKKKRQIKRQAPLEIWLRAGHTRCCSSCFDWFCASYKTSSAGLCSKCQWKFCHALCLH